MPGRTSGTRRGNGPGWGGPAKGKGTNQPKQDFGPDTNAQGHNAVTSVEDGNVNAVRRATRESMMMVWERIAEDQKAPHMAQIAAAEKWLDRVEGKAIARNLNVTTDDLDALDDEALAQRQREIEARLRANSRGAGAPINPAGPRGLVN